MKNFWALFIPHFNNQFRENIRWRKAFSIDYKSNWTFNSPPSFLNNDNIQLINNSYKKLNWLCMISWSEVTKAAFMQCILIHSLVSWPTVSQWGAAFSATIGKSIFTSFLTEVTLVLYHNFLFFIIFKKLRMLLNFFHSLFTFVRLMSWSWWG